MRNNAQGRGGAELLHWLDAGIDLEISDVEDQPPSRVIVVAAIGAAAGVPGSGTLK